MVGKARILFVMAFGFAWPGHHLASRKKKKKSTHGTRARSNSDYPQGKMQQMQQTAAERPWGQMQQKLPGTGVEKTKMQKASH
jgi:hypothetical protein